MVSESICDGWSSVPALLDLESPRTHIHTLCICVFPDKLLFHLCVCATALVRRSEDNLYESVLSFSEFMGTQTQFASPSRAFSLRWNIHPECGQQYLTSWGPGQSEE